jgi:hypothetical protein
VLLVLFVSETLKTVLWPCVNVAAALEEEKYKGSAEAGRA